MVLPVLNGKGMSNAGCDDGKHQRGDAVRITGSCWGSASRGKFGGPTGFDSEACGMR